MTTRSGPGDGPAPGLDAIMSERRQLINLAYRLLGSLAELLGSIFLLAAAVTGLRATNTRGGTEPAAIDAEPGASLAAS